MTELKEHHSQVRLEPKHILLNLSVTGESEISGIKKQVGMLGLIIIFSVSPPCMLYSFPPSPHAIFIHCTPVIGPTALKSGTFSGVTEKKFVLWSYMETKAKVGEDQVWVFLGMTLIVNGHLENL